MQDYEKLALIQFAQQQFEAVCKLAASDARGSSYARERLRLARQFDCATRPYARCADGYYGWVGKLSTSAGLIPDIKFMF